MTLPMVKIIDLQGFAYQVINSIFTPRDTAISATLTTAKKTVTCVWYSVDVLKPSYTFQCISSSHIVLVVSEKILTLGSVKCEPTAPTDPL